MAKRVRASTIAKFAAGAGGTGVLGFLIFGYLLSVGAITILDYSGDMECDGTLEDPCYAYITFVANEDIFLYPSEDWANYGLTTDKPVSDMWMARKWGENSDGTPRWYGINITGPCESTRCGKPRDVNKAAYSIAFREGREYTLRFTALKENPEDVIKWTWGIDGEEADPFWFPRGSGSRGSNTQLYNFKRYEEINKTLTLRWLNITPKCFNNVTNGTLQTAKKCYSETTQDTIQTRRYLRDDWQEIEIDGAYHNASDLDVWCYNTTDDIICKSTMDGDGKFKQEGYSKGMSYFILDKSNGKLKESTGRYGRFYKQELERSSKARLSP